MIPSDGWTTAQIVDDNLGNQAVFYLMALPLATATIGWAAAAATARLRYGRSVPALAYPVVQTAGPGQRRPRHHGPRPPHPGPRSRNPPRHEKTVTACLVRSPPRRPAGTEPGTSCCCAPRWQQRRPSSSSPC